MSDGSDDQTRERAVQQALRAALARQNALLAAIPDIVMEVDTNRVYTWANQPGRDFFGPDVLGREAADYFEGEQDTYGLVERLFQGDEQTCYVESWQRRHDGEKRLLAWWCRVLKDGSGNVTGALSTARDVTEERRIAAELQAAEERFRSFFDAAPIGKCMTAPDGRLLRVNLAFCKMLGYTAEELQTTSFVPLTHPEDLPESRECIRCLLAGEREQWTMDKRYLARDGHVVRTHVVTRLDRDAAGRPRYFLTHILNRSEHQRAEELVAVRLRLLEFAATHSLDALLQRTLDEVEALTGSQVGFYHLLSADQRSLSLQAWSTRTVEVFCSAQGSGRHYSLDEAGVWVDCVRQRGPVVHNDYATLPHKKGLPEGHAPVLRELVVPILRDGRIVAILGVGNKATDYTDEDVSTVTYLADIAWEIARRKQAEEALRAEEEKYRLITDNTLDIIWTMGLDLVFRYVNPAVTRVTGYAPEQWIGTELAEHLEPSEFDRLKEMLATELAQGPSDHGVAFETRLRRADGREVPVEVHAKLVCDEKGAPNQIQGVTLDITQRQELQARLAQADRLQTMGTLAAGIAHEINNPLYGIRSCLNHVLGAEKGAIDHQFVRLAVKETDRIADLIRNMKAFYQPHEGRALEADVAELLREVFILNRKYLEENMVKLVFSPSNAFSIECVPDQVKQVFINVITNAVEAMPDGGELHVQAHPLDDGSAVAVTFRDTGVGIAREDVPQIFDMFYSKKPMVKGVGLGLSVSYGIVKRHGGTLEVSSEQGKGTTVTVTLPQRTPFARQMQLDLT